MIFKFVLTFLALTLPPVHCTSEQELTPRSDQPVIVPRSRPEFKELVNSICEYHPSRGKHEAYNVELVFDPSWKEYCADFRGRYAKYPLFKGCPEYQKDSSIYSSLRTHQELCFIKVRLLRKPDIPLSYPELGPLGCLETILKCLADMLDIDDQLRPEKCEEVPFGDFWTRSNLYFGIRD